VEDIERGVALRRRHRNGLLAKTYRWRGGTFSNSRLSGVLVLKTEKAFALKLIGVILIRRVRSKEW
jgi:hypothetical protein